MKVQIPVLIEALDHQKKNVSITFTKVNTKFCLSLHYNAYNSYLFVNEKKIKAVNKNVNYPTQFCLESISDGLSAIQSAEVSLKGNVYDFCSRVQFY